MIFTLTNKVYDLLKWFTLVVLPAMSMLYVALANVWGFPYVTEIAGTIAAIDAFLAVVLGISISQFRARNPMYRLNLVKLAPEGETDWVLPEAWYELLTWIAQIILPALATLYGALAVIWGFPYGEQVVATIMAVDTFLGMLLGFSTAQFHKKVSQACVERPELWPSLSEVNK